MEVFTLNICKQHLSIIERYFKIFVYPRSLSKSKRANEFFLHIESYNMWRCMTYRRSNSTQWASSRGAGLSPSPYALNTFNYSVPKLKYKNSFWLIWCLESHSQIYCVKYQTAIFILYSQLHCIFINLIFYFKILIILEENIYE